MCPYFLNLSPFCGWSITTYFSYNDVTLENSWLHHNGGWADEILEEIMEKKGYRARCLLLSIKTKHKLLILLPFFILVFMLIFYNSVKLHFAQSQPTYTASAFTMALVRNDKRLAVELVIPAQRDDISTWLDSHQAFNCPIGFDYPIGMDFPPTLRDLKHTYPISQDVHVWKNSDNGSIMNDNILNYHTFYRCAIDINADRGLNFEIYELFIEKKGNKWFVNSWGAICKSERLNGCG